MKKKLMPSRDNRRFKNAAGQKMAAAVKFSVFHRHDVCKFFDFGRLMRIIVHENYEKNAHLKATEKICDCVTFPFIVGFLLIVNY